MGRTSLWVEVGARNGTGVERETSQARVSRCVAGHKIAGALRRAGDNRVDGRVAGRFADRWLPNRGSSRGGRHGFRLPRAAVKLDRLVALKVIAPAFAGESDLRERFRREGLAAAAIDHPHIVPVYEADEADGVLFLAMRYVDGVDLAVLIEREAPLLLSVTVRVVAHIASALDAAHARGILHRDVKPANVLCRSDAQPDRPELE
jgi:serine/threonine protein kinase